MKKIVIIGGGIIGLTSAYYLSKKGHSITVLDKGDFTNGCSYGNAGLIVPSHIIPLAAPNVLKQGFKWMFSPESPFSIMPSLKPSFIKWGLNFALHSNEKKVRKSSVALNEISQLSTHLYHQLDNDKELKINLQQKGLMMLFQTTEVEKDEIHTAAYANKLGVEAKVLSNTEAQELQPGIRLNAKGAVYYPNDGNISPAQFMETLVNYLEKAGVKLMKNSTVINIATHSNKITSVHTLNDIYEADEVIIAAGVWSEKLAKGLGVNLLLQPGKGYSFTQSTKQILSIPSILVESRVAVTPYDNYTRFAGAMVLGKSGNRTKKSKVFGMYKSINNFFPEMEVHLPETDMIWSGLRPCSMDGLPFIGRSKKYNNLIVASGHAMLGVSLSPATGKLVCELSEEKNPSVNLKPFALERK